MPHYGTMLKVNHIQQFKQKENETMDLPEILNTGHKEFTKSQNLHFTKSIKGEPGVKLTDCIFYPRSYNADGPGGNYFGL